MAAGAVTVLDIAMRKLGEGVFDLENQSFFVALTTQDQPLGPDFVGASGEALYSDLTDEVSDAGTGYTLGGLPLDGTDWELVSANLLRFVATATTWTTVTFTAKYAVIYLTGTGTDGDILAIVDLETDDPSGRTSAGGDFTIAWPSALFTLSRAS